MTALETTPDNPLNEVSSAEGVEVGVSGSELDAVGISGVATTEPISTETISTETISNAVADGETAVGETAEDGPGSGLTVVDAIGVDEIGIDEVLLGELTVQATGTSVTIDASRIGGEHTDMPVWDLRPLLKDNTVEELLEKAESLVEQMQVARGQLSVMSAQKLAVVFRAFAMVGDLLGRAMSFANLSHYRDTADHAAAALMAHVEERAAEITGDLTFIDVEWAEMHEDRVEYLMEDEALAFCRNHLEGMRVYGAHQLSEAEERVDAERLLSGMNSWSRLFEELEAEMTCEMVLPGREAVVMPFEEALAVLESSDPAVRKSAYECLTKAIDAGIKTRTFIYNTVMLDRSVSDKLRNFDTWVSAWNMENDTEDQHIDALIEAVKSRYDIAQRWYRLKARLLGQDVLQDWDRYAPFGSEDKVWEFSEGFETVKRAYARFSPLMGRLVEEFLTRGWLDAEIREHKAAGAFCDYTVASANPYVMLNWTKRRSDVLTLAHELGHGIHAYVSREQGFYHHETGMTMAETASVFGETLTFASMLEECATPEQRLSLLCQQIDDAVNTVFRQAALFSFEERAHTMRRDEGELSGEELAEIWLDSQREMFADSVELSDAAGSRWSYINHFFTAPGYVSAYPFGQLMALSVYARYLEVGRDFADDLLMMLHAGGSRSAEELAEMVGLDLADSGFWHKGLSIIDAQVTLAERIAEEAGII